MKKIYNLLFFVFFYIFSFSNLSGAFGIEKVDDGIVNKTGNITTNIVNLVTYLLGFTGLIGVIFVIYGGFKILTAAGDDEKVKSGKNTIIYSLLGIFVVLIAYSLVKGVYDGLDNNI